MRRRALAYRHASVVSTPNTFLKGTGAVDTAAELAAKLGLVEADILNFTVDGSYNIKCRIETVYTFIYQAFYRYSAVGNTTTYFIDLEGYCSATTGFTDQTFNFQTVPIAMVFPNIKRITSSMFANASVPYYYLPDATQVNTLAFDKNYSLKRIYIPSCTSLGGTTGNGNAFRLDSAVVNVYVNSTLMTNNGGGKDGDLAYLESTYGTTITEVTDTTPPGNITNLSASSITATTVDLDFTAPSSTNTLDFYEVWIDDGSSNPIQLYYPFDEISATGDTLSGLVSGTTYKIKIAACDEFWNGSGLSTTPAWSNEIEITTL